MTFQQTCAGCKHYKKGKLIATKFQGKGWCYLPNAFPNGTIVNEEGKCDQKESVNRVERFVETLKNKPEPLQKTKATQAPYRTMKDSNYGRWLLVWAEHQELRKTFKSFDEMRQLANSYGYRKKDVEAIIRHKKVRDEMMRT